MSEGIHDASGAPIAALLVKDLEHDAHGNVQLAGNGALADLLCEEIESKLNVKRAGLYSVDYELLPLDAVAGKTRTMEDEFISPNGTDVTDAFRMFLRSPAGLGHARCVQAAASPGGEGVESWARDRA